MEIVAKIHFLLRYQHTNQQSLHQCCQMRIMASQRLRQFACFFNSLFSLTKRKYQSTASLALCGGNPLVTDTGPLCGGNPLVTDTGPFVGGIHWWQILALCGGKPLVTATGPLWEKSTGDRYWPFCGGNPLVTDTGPFVGGIHWWQILALCGGKPLVTATGPLWGKSTGDRYWPFCGGNPLVTDTGPLWGKSTGDRYWPFVGGIHWWQTLVPFVRGNHCWQTLAHYDENQLVILNFPHKGPSNAKSVSMSGGLHVLLTYQRTNQQSIHFITILTKSMKFPFYHCTNQQSIHSMQHYSCLCSHFIMPSTTILFHTLYIPSLQCTAWLAVSYHKELRSKGSNLTKQLINISSFL